MERWRDGDVERGMERSFHLPMQGCLFCWTPAARQRPKGRPAPAPRNRTAECPRDSPGGGGGPVEVARQHKGQVRVRRAGASRLAARGLRTASRHLQIYTCPCPQMRQISLDSGDQMGKQSEEQLAERRRDAEAPQRFRRAKRASRAGRRRPPFLPKLAKTIIAESSKPWPDY